MPQVYVISGPIGSGKTETLNELSKRGINVIYEDIKEWQYYLEKFYNNPEEYGFLFQMEVISHFHRVTKKLEQMDDEEIVFVERSPIEVCTIFLNANKSIYPERVYDALVNVCHMYADRPVWKCATYVFLNADVKLCAERIFKRNRKGEDKIDGEYLKKIHLRYEGLQNAAPHMLLNSVIISEIGGEDSREQVMNKVLESTILKCQTCNHCDVVPDLM
jgi:deoxyadenosine/deoxycytidine kinase